MRVERRQMILGAAAAAVLGLAAWTFWPAAPAPAPAGVTPARARSAPPSAAEGPRPVAPVKLDALASSREEPGDAGRNPFRFKPKAPPPPPPRPPAPPVSEAPRPVFTAPAGPPPPPPIALKFIGVLERANGVKWAVLTDGKSPNTMHGKEGDIIDGRYLIVKIGTESIEMTYTDGRGRQVIRLTGQ
jgi:hypothetical protein